MDTDIAGWIVEFLLRHSKSESLVKRILNSTHVPVVNSNPRLKPTLIICSIKSEIRNGAISEKTLELLETMEELDRNEGRQVTDLMKTSYCAAAAAASCTTGYLQFSDDNVCHADYVNAVHRVWGGRLERLEEKKSQLLTDDLRRCASEIGGSVFDPDQRKVLLNRNTHQNALALLNSYIGEFLAMLGPPFIDVAVRCELVNESRRNKRHDIFEEIFSKDVMSDREDATNGGSEWYEQTNGDDDVAAETRNEPRAVHDFTGFKERVPKSSSAKNMNEIQTRKMFNKQKHAACRKHSTGPVQITESEDPGEDITSSKLDAIPTPDVERVQEALKSSSMELQAVVQDPLPNAVQFAESIVAQMAMRMLNRSSLTVRQNGNCSEPPNDTLIFSISEMARKILGSENFMLRHNSNDTYLSAQSGPVADSAKPTNANVDPSAQINQYTTSKPTLFERNSTAHTFEWEDPIEESSERTVSDGPKRKSLSPLKKYENEKFVMRRRSKKWSSEEEDALREGVRKFGKGNWKLILNSKRDVFVGRTEVDLKDKWRNLTRHHYC